MNSMSRGYNDSYGRDRDRERDRDRDRDRDCPTIIKCSGPNSTQIVVTVANPTATAVIASINIDKSCLCNPITKLEFATIISTAANGFAGTVSLRVLKQCRRQLTPTIIGTAWTLNVAANTTVPLSFFICDSDCDSCDNDCCTYTVEATITAAGANSGIVTFNNSTLGAISTCKKNCHNCRRDRD
ncbi:DUF4489 domain-containing protein [Clostridium tertium]